MKKLQRERELEGKCVQFFEGSPVFALPAAELTSLMKDAHEVRFEWKQPNGESELAPFSLTGMTKATEFLELKFSELSKQKTHDRSFASLKSDCDQKHAANVASPYRRDRPD